MIIQKNEILLRWTTVIILCLLFGCTNFHEVSNDTLYRSGQLNAKQLEKYIYKYKIKTVINLRGKQPEEKWYKEEMATMRKTGTFHIDIYLTATNYVPSERLDSIIAIASSAPKPILIHCKAGADRSGLFCAAWKYKVDHQLPEIASKQLSIIYGHIHFLIWKGTAIMDSSYSDYVKRTKISQIDFSENSIANQTNGTIQVPKIKNTTLKSVFLPE